MCGQLQTLVVGVGLGHNVDAGRCFHPVEITHFQLVVDDVRVVAFFKFMQWY